MQILVAAIGTRGDVQPLLALAKGLSAAGHSVRVATTAEFAALTQAHGLDYVAVSGSPSELMQGADLQAALGGNGNPLVMLRGIVAAVGPMMINGMRELLDAAQGADLIIASLVSSFPAFSVAEKLGIPCVEGQVLPARPTRAFLSPILGLDLRLGGAVNWLSNWALLQTGWALFQPMINRARQEALSLPPEPLRQTFARHDYARIPILYGYSPSVLPRPDDWPDWHHVCGYWFLAREDDWQPPDDLRDFLAAGPPPVYVGFGSMTGRDPERITAIVLAALHQTGQRGVLSTGWGGVTSPALLAEVSGTAENFMDNIYVLASAPHDWLFPRMAAVVHHGGAGTTAAGLRAGVPSILVPFTSDQPFWGWRVAQLGVGPTPIPHQTLTGERLAYALRVAADHQPMRQRAADLGARLRQEDGVSAAVQVVKRYLG